MGKEEEKSGQKLPKTLASHRFARYTSKARLGAGSFPAPGKIRAEDIAYMKKRDIIIIVAVLVVAAAGFLAMRLFSSGADYVYIYVNDALYEADPLNEDKLIEIDQGDGVVNHIQIKNGIVRMVDSTCPDKLCVKQGDLSAESYEKFPVPIACLPNKVIIELKTQDKE